MNIECKVCEKETDHKLIRNFGIKKWYGCKTCNNIQVIKNDNK